MQQNWAITGDDGQLINVTSATSATDLTAVPNGADRRRVSPDLMVWNPGPNVVYVRAGQSDVQATTLSLPIPPGTLQPLGKGFSTHLAAICASGQTQAIVVFVGRGT